MTDYDQKARRGQALNLAVADALANKKGDDTNYILSKYVQYHDLSAMVQGLTIEAIKDAITGG